MHYTRTPLFKKFLTFSQMHLRAQDAHPEYPVLKAYYEQRKLEPEQALWFTLIEVTWDNLRSSEVMWKAYPHMTRITTKTTKLPTSTARRSFRGTCRGQGLLNEIYAHCWNNYDHAHPLCTWIESQVQSGDKRQNWRNVRTVFEAFKGNGPWAGYKWADLLKNVHGYPLEADNIGVGGGEGSFNTGPVQGLAKITGYNPYVVARDIDLQEVVLDHVREKAVPKITMDQLETCLCNFNSLTEGRLYVGNDIDEQLEAMKHASAELRAVRLKVFEPKYLGELGGWTGVRKALKTHYQRTGELIT